MMSLFGNSMNFMIYWYLVRVAVDRVGRISHVAIANTQYQSGILRI